MYWVYILKSDSANRYYIGQISELEKRLNYHLTGKSTYTKIASDWKLVFTKECGNREEAQRIKRFIKRQKSKVFIEKIITDKIDFKKIPG